MASECVSIFFQQRVCLIKSHITQGSAFFLRIEDGIEYLVTAKHVVIVEKVDPPENEPAKIGIFHDGSFSFYDIDKIWYFEGDEYKDKNGNDLYDVAVIRLKSLPPLNFMELPPNKNIGYGQEFRAGQDFYFMGYPAQLPINSMKRDQTAWPLPYIKKGIYSLVSDEAVFIDAVNCNGFSGGPIVYYNEIRKQPFFGGVISGYIQHEAQTSKPSTYYWMNTGITRATSIDKVMDIFQQFDSPTPITPKRRF